MDSAFHILSVCQCPIIRNMETEQHNIAGRMILKVVSEGSYGSNFGAYGCRQRRPSSSARPAHH
eukprot:333069-Pelagomonas_calceolata.AAC.1